MWWLINGMKSHVIMELFVFTTHLRISHSVYKIHCRLSRRIPSIGLYGAWNIISLYGWYVWMTKDCDTNLIKMDRQGLISTAYGPITPAVIKRILKDLHSLVRMNNVETIFVQCSLKLMIFYPAITVIIKKQQNQKFPRPFWARRRVCKSRSWFSNITSRMPEKQK